MKKSREELISAWKAEENIAHIHGWDFSHIENRYEEDTSFPWNYKSEIIKYLRPEMKLLDIDTGGGEFLLSLSHPYDNTSATEGFSPNVELCKSTLTPLGITVKEADAKEYLPFEDGSFDIVINRHGDFNPKEIYRVLKEGGLFITQQVGANNDRELVDLLFNEKLPLPFPGQFLDITCEKFKSAGFEILDSNEAYRKIKFFDVGALVWFARIIEWEFPGFSVERNIENLIKVQSALEANRAIEGRTHRFFLVARK